MKLRARWCGLPPRPGDYLMSATRPRFAYHVRKITQRDPHVCWDPAQKAESRRLVITADRVSASTVPSAARVHTWSWDKRQARTR